MYVRMYVHALHAGSLEEGQDGGEAGVLLVDLLRGSGAGRRVHGDAGGQPATGVGDQVHQQPPTDGDGRSLLHSRLRDVCRGVHIIW